MATDSFLRHTSDFKPRPGFSVLDEAKFSEGSEGRFRLVRRTFIGEEHKKHVRLLRRAPDEVLCPGASAGMDKLGIVRHAYATDDRLIGFSGFIVDNQDGNKVTVFARGIITLSVAGITDKSRGMAVFCESPNGFNLAGIGLEIGRLLFVEGKQAAVAFKAWDDAHPLNLDVKHF